MNRINKLFNEKKQNILSLYFCAGHPTAGSTADIIRTLAARGIDMLEIGIPFSDPMADGPVIQDAATKALQNGMSLHRLFEELKDIRQDVEIPLILMGYLNPIFHYGFEAFCQSCADCGIDGVIIPDLPFRDYMETFKPIADRHGLKIIMLITPETSKERIRLIDRHTDGFIYMVSSAATTGAQKEFDRTKQAYFDRVNQMGLTHPRMIGFGISNRQTLESAQKHAAGAIIGSGGLVVMDEDTCMVSIAQFFMNFICNESCGKCTPCREGTTRMLDILTRITKGNGRPGDIEELRSLAKMIQNSSLCGLGKTAPNPVLSTLANFEDEYREHIFDKKCRTGSCRSLTTYVIDPAICKGCTKCARNCPAGAITGELKKPHHIDPEKCIKCGTCKSGCPFGAIKEA